MKLNKSTGFVAIFVVRGPSQLESYLKIHIYLFTGKIGRRNTARNVCFYPGLNLCNSEMEKAG